ncbi:MAG: chromate resistance protein ChrB domain-containing protein [Acidiferrobacterales bacterium]
MVWLLLIHQLPTKPAYFRVKIWRRLQNLGAVAIKNSVYTLPSTEQTQEDFQWLVREITQGGGEASICEANFVDGLTDEQIQALFNAAREAEYQQLADEAHALLKSEPANSSLSSDRRAELTMQVRRLDRQFAQIRAVDFFGAPNREATAGLMANVEARIAEGGKGDVDTAEQAATNLVGRTWVTREGIQIDRIASAWLIRRFVDPKARFKFVRSRGYRPQPEELRFDMFDAEFTHEGDRCTFEVLLERADLDQPALRHIAEIVHDIDLKDGKFEREEAAGVARLITGLAMANKDDDARLSRGSVVFDDLYEYFRSARP